MEDHQTEFTQAEIAHMQSLQAHHHSEYRSWVSRYELVLLLAASASFISGVSYFLA